MDTLFNKTEGSPDIDSPDSQPNSHSIHFESNGNYTIISILICCEIKGN